MRWQRKAMLQGWLARLPRAAGDTLYWTLQRQCGEYRRLDPEEHVEAVIHVLREAARRGVAATGMRVLEVGSGRRLTIPICLWLAGAARVTTVDLNRQLKDVLLASDVAAFGAQGAGIVERLRAVADPALFDTRLERLRATGGDRAALLRELPIDYLAPGDAARLALADGSVDLHISRSVLEHIPPATLSGIFAEARRVLTPHGLFLHGVDFSDHFAHTDDGITRAHFLQWSRAEWARLSGNRFNYHNRLRVDDVAAMIEASGLRLLATEPNVDARSLAALQAGLRVDGAFAGKPLETLATANAWFVATPAGVGP